jgi:hypothetical protein
LVGQRLSRMYLDKKNLHLLLVCGLFGAAPLWAVELKEAEITALKNIVEHDAGEGKGATPAHASEKIYEKSKVSTAAASMAELTFADTSITRVGANTSFSFQSKERLVKLEKGTVLINTPPGAGGATVECGGVTAAVTGTTFMCSVDGNGNKMFVLLEGAGGMKVTAGGKTTMVRAGQAASVGGGEGGGKKEDSGGGPGEKKAGGDKPGADTKESGGSKESGGDNAGAGDGGKPKAAAPAPAADKGPGEGSAGGGKPPAAPTIQVFDVDVQKVVASTPLIQAFDKPLPSAQKIQATVEVQQAKMSEGKMESLGVEIVAVKADGDVLVGAPKVAAEAPPKKEEPKADAPAKKEDVVAKKEEVAAKKEDGGLKPEPKADAKADPKMAGGPAPDKLDISTAAGPGAEARPAPTTATAPAPKPPAPAPVVAVPPAASIVGQIINGATRAPDPSLVGRAPAGTIVLGDPNNPFTISLTSPLKSAATAVFTVTIGNVSVGGSFPIAAGATSFSILGSSIPDPRIYAKGQTAVVSLTLPGTIGTITQTIKLDSRPLSDPVVQAANPMRALATLKANIPLLTAFDKYFYFVGAIPGSMGALEKYFINAPGSYDPAGTTSQYIPLASTQKVELATNGEIQDFDFFAAQAIEVTDVRSNNFPAGSNREDVFFYANRVLLGKQPAGFSGTTLNPLAMDDSFMEFWDGGWRDWAVLGGSVQGGVTLELPSTKEKVGFVAGTGGISIQGVKVGANGAAIEVLTSGNLLVQAASFLDLSPVRETSFESLGRIQMGATTEELAALATIETSAGRDPIPAQEALQEERQVRIESRGGVSNAGEAITGGVAVVRSATGLEMRDVVIRGFGQIELAKGLESSAPRVLVSGSSVRDFKIKELVGAFINADSKIQMAALDASGELAGTMVVQNGLPVNRQLAGVLDKTITDSRKNLLVDAQTVSLAAKRLEFQNTTIAAMSAINARANTVLLNNANFTVIAQNGMINFYTQQGLVNRTFGSDGGSDNGKLNFTGVNNFRIGNNSFTVQDQATLNQHYGNNIVDMNQNFGRPEAGKVNVLKM